MATVNSFNSATRQKQEKYYKRLNEAFVASSGDIITNYDDYYCLFKRHVASCRVNITMSACL